MASVGGPWAPLISIRLLRTVFVKTAATARASLSTATGPVASLSQAAARHPARPATLIRQARRARAAASRLAPQIFPARLFSSARATAQRSRISDGVARRLAQSPGRAPFASTLRPSLAGGTLPRTAGGYGLGAGGARFFSHTPAAPAEVIQHVSQAMRAFFVSGKRAQYDGLTARGEKRYRAVSVAEEEAARRMAAVPSFAPGAYIDFRLSPTVTALGSLSAGFPYATPAAKGYPQQLDEVLEERPSLGSADFLAFLKGDFDRAAHEMATVLADLQRLAHLGDLPVTLEGPALLRVRFPGVDAHTVERLCEDMGVRRGFIGEDPGLLDDRGGLALQFPYAPEAALSSPGGSLRSLTSHGEAASFIEHVDLDDLDALSDPEDASQGYGADAFEGLEGIHRFLDECERVKGRYGK